MRRREVAHGEPLTDRGSVPSTFFWASDSVQSFTSVVGPNGSGKSNVIDSMLFVFGFRATKMRQAKLSELIHNSAKFPDVQQCSVAVHFVDILDLVSTNHACARSVCPSARPDSNTQAHRTGSPRALALSPGSLATPSRSCAAPRSVTRTQARRRFSGRLTAFLPFHPSTILCGGWRPREPQLVVTRTATKTNKSQYYVNDKASNFTEVTDLLKARGIDLDHKRFLILQGEVEAISQMKPKAPSEHEDGLLEYLEDIIGTSALKVCQRATTARHRGGP